MPSFCAVVDCGSRGNRDLVSFFRIPAILKDRGEHLDQLSVQRREAWIKALRRENLSEVTLKYARICSRHFISGEPAKLNDVNNPDWVPSQNMGYRSIQTVTSQAVDRYTRHVNRAKRRREDDTIAGSSSSTQITAEGADECEESAGIEVQTDLDMNEISNLLEQMQFSNERIYSLETKLQKCELSEESFKNNDTKTRYFTGFAKSEMLFIIFNYISPNLSLKCHSSPFQQFILTMMKLRLNLPFKYLSYRFSISPSTTSDIFYKCIDIIFDKFKALVYWPDRDHLRKNVPACFKENFGDKVAVIIDCFEIFTETPSNLLNAARFWSNYKHHQTVKFLIGITPHGSISYISEAWVGRTSDKFLTENCGFLNLILPGDVILADRGFLIRDAVEALGGHLEIPAFTKGKNQLDPVDLESTRNIATVRIHVERIIGFLKKKYKICQGPIPISMLSTSRGNLGVLDKIITVCSALINLSNSQIPMN